MLQDKPCLIAWGEKDFVFDAPFLNKWLEYFPEAEVHRFPDCGHYVLEDGGPALIDTISNFIGIREDSNHGHASGKTWNTDEFSNVASALSWQAQRQPNVTAIHYPKSGAFRKHHYESCTYQELNELSDCYARGLHEYGIGPGTRTALMLTPGLDFFAMFFALFKAGAVPVLIDPGIGMKPLKQCLAEAQPKAFIGVTKAHFARKILGWAKESCELLVTAGPTLGLGGINLKKLKEMGEPAATKSRMRSSRMTWPPFCSPPAAPAYPKAWCTATGISMPRWKC